MYVVWENTEGKCSFMYLIIKRMVRIFLSEMQLTFCRDRALKVKK